MPSRFENRLKSLRAVVWRFGGSGGWRIGVDFKRDGAAGAHAAERMPLRSVDP